MFNNVACQSRITSRSTFIKFVQSGVPTLWDYVYRGVKRNASNLEIAAGFGFSFEDRARLCLCVRKARFPHGVWQSGNLAFPFICPGSLPPRENVPQTARGRVESSERQMISLLTSFFFPGWKMISITFSFPTEEKERREIYIQVGGISSRLRVCFPFLARAESLPQPYARKHFCPRKQLDGKYLSEIRSNVIWSTI